MKTLSLCAVILFSIFSINTSTAQAVKKETIKVWGNCGMCKKTIEKSAISAGAASANWNTDSKQLKVSYAVNKTSGTKIQQAIANSGYDTQDFTADNNAYQKLHSCCQYDRKEAVGMADIKKSCGMEKSCCNKPAATTEIKKCCGNATCKHDEKAGACKDMAGCKEKSCCSKVESMD
ncbi:MAG: hypothetical protein ABI741_13725 [Ferruginibacter sp.]